MPYSLGTRGNDGNSLVRDKKKFDANLAEVDFSKMPQRKPKRVSGGKKTYTYGK
jgi:hypothetical protein